MMLGAAGLGWFGSRSREESRAYLVLASLLALPLSPMLFAFFSFMGLVGITPSALFMAAAIQPSAARPAQGATQDVQGALAG